MIFRNLSFLLVGILLLGTGCSSGSKTDYEGRTFKATSFSPLQSDLGESWITFNSDNSRAVFGRHEEGWSSHTLYETMRGDQGWSKPTILPFSGTYNDRGARYYPALDALIFSSDRPLIEGGEAGDFNLWIAMHDGEEWLPVEVFQALNSTSNDFHGSVAADGSIYFASNRPGGKGKSDLYHAVLGSSGYIVTPLSGFVNTKYSESDVMIDVESRFLIFSRTDDPGGFGADDLWISFPSAEGWSEAVNLGPEVNTAEGEYGAMMSLDATKLYFTTHKDGKADIVFIPMTELVLEWPTN
jgi:hypothetical protein